MHKTRQASSLPSMHVDTSLHQHLNDMLSKFSALPFVLFLLLKYEFHARRTNSVGSHHLHPINDPLKILASENAKFNRVIQMGPRFASVDLTILVIAEFIPELVNKPPRSMVRVLVITSIM